MNRADRRAQAKAARRAPPRHALERGRGIVAMETTMRQHREADPDKVTTLMIELHSCFDAMKNGTTDTELFDRLGASMNNGLIRAESIAPEAVDVMLGAQRAMNEASAIYERHGRFGFTGTGIQAMADALDLYGQIVAMSTPRQILEAAQEARRRVERQLKELGK